MNKQADISSSVPDWTREKIQCFEWTPAKRLLRTIRRHQSWKKCGGFLSWILCPLFSIRHRFWSVVCGADIPLNSQLGGGLVLHHHGNGIVIHPKANIGPNCLIFHQATIAGSCKIGGHVDIGAGAKILGNVAIGDHAKIGANAVVLCDVPNGATAVGVPARVIEKNCKL